MLELIESETATSLIFELSLDGKDPITDAWTNSETGLQDWTSDSELTTLQVLTWLLGKENIDLTGTETEFDIDSEFDTLDWVETSSSTYRPSIFLPSTTCLFKEGACTKYVILVKRISQLNFLHNWLTDKRLCLKLGT